MSVCWLAGWLVGRLVVVRAAVVFAAVGGCVVKEDDGDVVAAAAALKRKVEVKLNIHMYIAAAIHLTLLLYQPLPFSPATRCLLACLPAGWLVGLLASRMKHWINISKLDRTQSYACGDILFQDLARLGCCAVAPAGDGGSGSSAGNAVVVTVYTTHEICDREQRHSKSTFIISKGTCDSLEFCGEADTRAGAR